MHRHPLAAVVPVLAGAIAACAPSASAAVRFRPCTGLDRGALCARVAVPLDRSGATPGSVRLLVERVPKRPRRRDVLIVLVGGPGQAATPLRDAVADAIAPALRSRELVVFDQRGTGRSGLLRCPTVEARRVRDETGAVAACAARLGAKRSLFTTRDSVEDIEAVRQALGVEKVSLLGVSYGTKVALAYSAAHPDRVDRLALDSTVGLDGPDLFARSSAAAIPRVLGDLCRGRRCSGIARDPLAELGRLAGKLRLTPLRGVTIGSRGQRRRATLREANLFGLVLASDVDPTLLPALPAAVHSVLRGDSAPILRLARMAASAEEPGAPQEFSTAVLVATLCEEGALPWARTANLDQRRAELGAAADALGDGPFAPFGRAAAVAVSVMPACLGWPAAPAAPELVHAPVPVPTVLIGGTADLRTPLEDARAIAATLPDARVLSVAGVGHSVLSTATTRCPGRALGAFFSGRPVRKACRRDALLDVPPDPVAPLRLAEVPRVPGLGSRRGRTVGAVLLTLQDTGASLLAELPSAVLDILTRGTTSVGGLRGGYVTLDLDGIRLHRAVYVPGVVVDGRVRFLTRAEGGLDAHFRVSGRAAVDGTVDLRADGTLTGRLGGRRFRLRGGREITTISAAGGQASSPVGPVVRLRKLLERRSGGRPFVGRPPLW